MFHKIDAATLDTAAHTFGKGQPLKAHPLGREIGVTVRTFESDVRDFTYQTRTDGFVWAHTSTAEGHFFAFDTTATRNGDAHGPCSAGEARFFVTAGERDKALAKYLKALAKAAPSKR